MSQKPEPMPAPPARPIDAGDTTDEQLATRPHGGSDQAKPLDEKGNEEPTQRGKMDLVDLREVLDFIANRETALDIRFEAMENALAKKAATIIVGQLGPVQAAMRVLSESQQRQERMLKEGSEAAVALITRVSQLEQKLEQQLAVCKLRHGNGLSVPPGDAGANLPPDS